jgi:hypothetical protein
MDYAIDCEKVTAASGFLPEIYLRPGVTKCSPVANPLRWSCEGLPSALEIFRWRFVGVT